MYHDVGLPAMTSFVFLNEYTFWYLLGWQIIRYRFQLMDASDMTLTTNVNIDMKPRTTQAELANVQLPSTRFRTTNGILTDETRRSAALRQSTNQFAVVFRRRSRRTMIQSDVFPTKATTAITTNMTTSTTVSVREMIIPSLWVVKLSQVA